MTVFAKRVSLLLVLAASPVQFSMPLSHLLVTGRIVDGRHHTNSLPPAVKGIEGEF